MKKSILKIFMPFVLLGCDPQGDPPDPPTPVTSIKFYADGVLYQWDGSLADNNVSGTVIKRETPNNPNQYFELTSQNADCGSTYCKFIYMKIYTTSSLQVGTYPNIWTSTGEMNTGGGGTNPVYQTFNTPYTFNAQITRLENGYADGTFSGTVERRNVPAPYPLRQITNGEFKNVRVIN